MTAPLSVADRKSALENLATAAANKSLSASAVENIRVWLTAPRYAAFAPDVAGCLASKSWEELEEAFWTVMPFGTAGRRGRMFPFGSNAINDATIGETAQGLADYILGSRETPDTPTCMIAYDTRHRSREFAELCASIMVAAGFHVYFLDGIRSTPALSTGVRYKQANCGVMITASHNPPSDNAIKIFWSSGGQVRPPHDRGIILAAEAVQAIQRADFADALAAGQIEYCQDEIDQVYRDAALRVAFPGAAEIGDLRILYSPLHGVGHTSVMPTLMAAGYSSIDVFAPQAKPNGDFPNVPRHIANPENPEIFHDIAAQTDMTQYDLILVTDPDADRIGCSAPSQIGGTDFRPIDGNKIGVLIGDYILNQRQTAGTLSEKNYVIKTLVTSDMLCRVARSYGVNAYRDVLTGFKWIGGLIDEVGPAGFLLGVEEAHGYLAGTHTRDKDGAVAAILLASAAGLAKSTGLTLHQQLDRLYEKHGCHLELTIAITMPGADGMQRTRRLMARLRERPLPHLGPLAVTAVRDYQQGHVLTPDGKTRRQGGPHGNLVIIDTEADGNHMAVRPSGTEPKLKFYFFTYLPPAESLPIEEAKKRLRQRLDEMAADVLEQLGVERLAEAT